MFGLFPDIRWYLYDNCSGRVVLKHPYKPGMDVPCPHCGVVLVVESYEAECCGQVFKTGFGEICQKEAVGTHTKRIGRGWKSLRPYEAEK